MTAKLSSAVLPAYLFLCIVLGGSAQGVWGNAFLQLAAIGLILWTSLGSDSAPLPRGTASLCFMAACAALVVALQFVPLPPEIRTPPTVPAITAATSQ